MICEKRVKQFCCEDISLIENYDKAIVDTTQTWHCHHRLEIQGDKTFSVREMIEMKLYYDRPASELIFLTLAEHTKIHFNGKKCRKFSEEHRKKLSKSHIGIKSWIAGKHHSEESKLKMSEAKKGKPSNRKGKKHSIESIHKMSESHKGNKSHLGIKHSMESKLKMRLKRLGKTPGNKGKHKVWNDSSHTKYHFE